MIWTEQTIRALNIAAQHHNEQTDKIGVPYLIHVYEVGRNQDTEDAVITGFMHDILEDCCKHQNYEEARSFVVHNLGFSEAVFEALWLLNHKGNTPYRAYIEQIARNKLARKVKIQDIKHNLSASRLNLVPKNIADRLQKKYRPALAYLVVADHADLDEEE